MSMLSLEEMGARVSALEATLVNGTQEQFDLVLRKDYERWQRIVKSLDIKIQ